MKLPTINYPIDLHIKYTLSLFYISFVVIFPGTNLLCINYIVNEYKKITLSNRLRWFDHTSFF